MKIYNRTTAQIDLRGRSGTLTLEASDTAGQDGPALNVTGDFNAVTVLNEVADETTRLVTDGSIRFDYEA